MAPTILDLCYHTKLQLQVSDEFSLKNMFRSHSLAIDVSNLAIIRCSYSVSCEDDD